jgi:hypothetical protein
MEDKIFDIVTDLIRDDITKQEAIDKLLVLYSVINWVAFDWMKIETRPTKYGKYLITRKDGKIHWETWNGSGWAYNHNEIRYWAEIKPPCIQRIVYVLRGTK